MQKESRQTQMIKSLRARKKKSTKKSLLSPGALLTDDNRNTAPVCAGAGVTSIEHRQNKFAASSCCPRFQ
jgi:hypothetical protein